MDFKLRSAHPGVGKTRSLILSALSLDLILPRYCLVCSRAIRGGVHLCYRCKPSTPDLENLKANRCQSCFGVLSISSEDKLCSTCRYEPLLTDSIRYIWEYDGLARDLIRHMKYRPSDKLTRLAAAALSDALPQLYPDTTWDLIAPIPSSHTNFLFRLFHPCQELALALSKSALIPARQVLDRNTTRAPQASLNHTRRLKRLSSLFTVRSADRIRGKRILIVEDVITTGATISAAAFRLKQAGADRIDVLSLSRTQVWSRFRNRIAQALPNQW
jgi:ComF family protein